MFTICFDTLCQGYQPIMEDENPVTYATEAEAQAEIDADPEFYDECFVCPLADIGHKTIWHPEKQEQ